MAEHYTFELERVEDLDAGSIEEIARIVAEIIIRSRFNHEKGDETCPDT